MNHQKLHCYQRLLNIVKEVQAHMLTWPRGEAEVKDQIKRALISAVLNLVEGNGRLKPKDRRCFFNRSTASLTEVSACLDLISLLHPDWQIWATEQKESVHIAYAQIRNLR